MGKDFWRSGSRTDGSLYLLPWRVTPPRLRDTYGESFYLFLGYRKLGPGGGGPRGRALTPDISKITRER